MNNNTIAFIALCNDYCNVLSSASSQGTKEFIDKMLHLLPRIYICAYDLKPEKDTLSGEDEDAWIDQVLTEEEYSAISSDISVLMGENDVYLEVFEEDMKYSDTPVAASVSENLADIYQFVYDFLNTVRFATDDVTDIAVRSIINSFKESWSRNLCNVLRALNHIWANDLIGEAEDDFKNNESLD